MHAAYFVGKTLGNIKRNTIALAIYPREEQGKKAILKHLTQFSEDYKSIQVKNQPLIVLMGALRLDNGWPVR